jgi:quercetin 2,3-dioxygenase
MEEVRPGEEEAGPLAEPSVWEGRPATVGHMTVHRTLPRRDRRTVGAWCFCDHFGPVADADSRVDVAPHPHCGLQTMT